MALDLKQISSLRINEGTENSPFILTDQEVAVLYELANSGNEKIAIEGVTTTVTGQISKSQAFSIKKAFPNLVIKAEEINDTGWEVFLSSASIDEGKSVFIRAVNIDISALNCEVDRVSINVTSGNMTEIGLRSGITIDMENEKISVAQPTSNATWIASVTFKFYPKYLTELTAEDYHYATLAVSAIGVTGIDIDMPTEIGMRETVTPINIINKPDNNTKASLISYNGYTDRGRIIPQTWNNGESSYFSHGGEEGEHSLEVRCAIAGNVVAWATKQLNVGQARIYVTIRKDATLTIDPTITLTAQNGEKYVLKDGDTLDVAGNGTETFSVEWIEYKGFKVTAPKTIQPTKIRTDLVVEYAVILPDTYLVYEDGTIEKYDDVANRNFNPLVGRIPVGVGVQTADCSFMIAGREETQTSMQWRTSVALIDGITTTTASDIVLRKFDGEKDTAILIQDPECTAANYCYGKTISYNGETRHGYLPSVGELKVASNNITNINNLLRGVFVVNNVTINSGFWWSSAQFNASLAWVLYNGNPFNTNKANYYNVRPFYAF